MLRISLLILTATLLSCNSDKSTPASKIETTPGITTIYSLNNSASKSKWEITFNSEKIQMEVPLSAGKISVLEGVPVAGDFEINLADLLLFQQNEAKKREIENYLRDTLVFNTREFPLARGILSKIERIENKPNFNYHLSVDLKIANRIKAIQCDANIQIADSTLLVNCEALPIDLIEWGIKNQEKTIVQFLLTFRKKSNE